MAVVMVRRIRPEPALERGKLVQQLSVDGWLLHVHPRQSAQPAATQLPFPRQADGGDDNVRLQEPSHQVGLSTAAVALTAAGLGVGPLVSLAGAAIVIYLDVRTLAKAARTSDRAPEFHDCLLRLAMHGLVFAAGAYVLGAVETLLNAVGQQHLRQAEAAVSRELAALLTLPAAAAGQTIAEPTSPGGAAKEDPVPQVGSMCLRAGELAPVNGVVTHGLAMIERPSAPPGAVVFVGENDVMRAADLILAGEVQVQAEQPLPLPWAELVPLAEPVTLSAPVPSSWQRSGGGVTDGFPLPLIGLGALATLAFGPLSGATILSARFGANLDRLLVLLRHRAVLRAAQHNLWIKDERALERLAALDGILWAADVLTRPTARAALAGLRRRGVLHHYVFAGSLPPKAATELGLEILAASPDGAQQQAQVAALQQRHRCLGFVGAGAAELTWWQHVDLAFLCTSVPFPTLPVAVQLTGDLAELGLLVDLGREVELAVANVKQMTAWPGLVALLGALAPGIGFGLAALAQHLSQQAALQQALLLDGASPAAQAPAPAAAGGPAAASRHALPATSLMERMRTDLLGLLHPVRPPAAIGTV